MSIYHTSNQQAMSEEWEEAKKKYPKVQKSLNILFILWIITFFPVLIGTSLFLETYALIISFIVASFALFGLQFIHNRNPEYYNELRSMARDYNVKIIEPIHTYLFAFVLILSGFIMQFIIAPPF